MTKRNRRTWDGHRNVKQLGFDSDYQNFTLTYSEALEPSIEATMLKIVVNGFMCGFPICCVLDYSRRWFRFSKTGDAKDAKGNRFGTTDLGQPFAMCTGSEHDMLGVVLLEQIESSEPLNTTPRPLSVVEDD